MTYEEIMQAAADSEGTYQPGSPLQEDDFIVYSTGEELEKHDYNMLTDLYHNVTGWYIQLYDLGMITWEGEEYDGKAKVNDRYYFCTHRGIVVAPHVAGEQAPAPSPISKDDVLARYGAGVSGEFDPQNDELYKNYNANRNLYREVIEEMEEIAASWVFYDYGDLAQIKFYFDSDDNMCKVVFFHGIQARADRETIKRVQEYLNANGYECGMPDGIAGNKTVAALKKFQGDHDMVANGRIDDVLMKYLDEQP